MHDVSRQKRYNLRATKTNQGESDEESSVDCIGACN